MFIRPQIFAAILIAISSGAQAEELTLIGEFTLPTGLKIEGVELGGLSAIDYDLAQDQFYALSDDRAQRGPARVYPLKLEMTEAGIAGVDISAPVVLTDADGQPYAPKSVDPEGFRLIPGGAYWSSESGEDGAPFVVKMARDGRTAPLVFEIPDYHRPGAGMGARNNKAFEALAVDEEGRVIVGLENALVQDGPVASLEAGSPARVLLFPAPDASAARVAPFAEYVYPVDPIAAAPVPAGEFADNGLVELLARPEGGFYALERSFSAGVGTTIKLFTGSFEGASDVLGVESLKSASYTPITKRLILTLQSGGVTNHVDNLEGITFGPAINGQRTLVLISDNNFNPRGQLTQIIAFKVF